jgi:hypothetical protein
MALSAVLATEQISAFVMQVTANANAIGYKKLSGIAVCWHI